MRVYFLFVGMFVIAGGGGFSTFAQQPAHVNEYQKQYTTYPFSDPDPVANSGKIYPYFRYDGFTNKPIKKSWKVVELENDFLKVQIMPEIGGKIWTAINKKTGQPFLYDNDVVKFRDIAMRGPWTSGGIEANFGIIGHTPAVATPVDYLTRQNADGSASCFISNLDLLTRSRWILEINLPKDKAYFITRVHWHNGSGEIEPYYSWMNLAVKVSVSLHFIDPGTFYIGHDGTDHPWPVDTANGKDLSVYGQNNFGRDKSYHIMGSHSKYFGAWWPEEKNGMIHYAEREDKLGRKVFLWALSDQGKIWEELLTNGSGQYAEIQSGRLFNQNVFSSSYTPFKQVPFYPYQTDSWSEYWYPFGNTGGVGLADLNGVLHAQGFDDSLRYSVSAVSEITDTLLVTDTNGQVVYQKMVHLKPLEVISNTVPFKSNLQIAQIRLGSLILNYADPTEKDLERPATVDVKLNQESAYAKYLLGRDAANQRIYDLAEEFIHASLLKDPAFGPSLSEMSALQYRRMNYDSAVYFAKKALSVDTYDPKANYYYGLAQKELDKYYDAMDGFEVASLSPEYSSASFTEISKMLLARRDYHGAMKYANRSLQRNAANISGLQLRMVAARLIGDEPVALETEKSLLAIDPLSPFVAFEIFLRKRDKASEEHFKKMIRNELPAETYLELAIWYYVIGTVDECRTVLELAPENNEIQYWLAYLNRDSDAARKLLDAADSGSAWMIFPFRSESARVMQWAVNHTSNWKPAYYLALIQAFKNNRKEAKHLLDGLNNDIPFAPLYATRARLNSNDKDLQRADLQRARALAPDEWRYVLELSEMYLQEKDFKTALQIVAPYYKSHRDNYIIGSQYIRSLIGNNMFAEAEKELAAIHILPFEGATSGHRLYRETKLMLALNALKKKNYKTALNKVAQAREWPLNLGAGKPFPEAVNESLENEIEQLIRDARANRSAKVDFDRYENLIQKK